jgi:hypothetical protein
MPRPPILNTSTANELRSWNNLVKAQAEAVSVLAQILYVLLSVGQATPVRWLVSKCDIADINPAVAQIWECQARHSLGVCNPVTGECWLFSGLENHHPDLLSIVFALPCLLPVIQPWVLDPQEANSGDLPTEKTPSASVAPVTRT